MSFTLLKSNFRIKTICISLLCILFLEGCQNSSGGLYTRYFKEIHGLTIENNTLIYVLNLDACSDCVLLHLNTLLSADKFCKEAIVVFSGYTSNPEFTRKIDTLQHTMKIYMDKKNQASRYGLAAVKPSVYVWKEQHWKEWSVKDEQVGYLINTLSNCDIEFVEEIVVKQN